MKVSFIGAGSIGFTQTLVRDLLKVPEFHDTNFFFHDISEKNLNFVSKLIQKDIDANNLPTTIEQSETASLKDENTSQVSRTLPACFARFRASISSGLHCGFTSLS